MRIHLLAMAITLCLVSCVKKPVADFEFKESKANPLIFQFTNNSEGAETYLWNFGDGSTSTDASPMHHYGQQGTYSVVLTVQNGNEFSSSTKKVVIDNVTWKINKMTATFTKPDFEFISDSTIMSQDQSKSYIKGYQKISTGSVSIDIHLPRNLQVGKYLLKNDQVTATRWYGSVVTNYNAYSAYGHVSINQISEDTLRGSFNIIHKFSNYGSIEGEFKVGYK